MLQWARLHLVPVPISVSVVFSVPASELEVLLTSAGLCWLREKALGLPGSGAVGPSSAASRRGFCRVGRGLPRALGSLGALV